MSSYFPMAVVALAMMGALLGAVEIGYRRGLRTPAEENLESHATAWEAALLGLLALLIGQLCRQALCCFWAGVGVS